MLSQGQELAALDFAAIIGGPMQAVIKAQGASAQLTASFIQEVGFTPGTGTGGTSANSQTLKVVTFDFSSVLGGSTTGSTGSNNVTLGNLTRINVPLLTMVPIPFLRVDSMTIQLNVRLVAQSSQTLTNNFAFSNSDTATGTIFHLGAAFQATVSEQNTLQNGQIIDDTYSLNVTVHCVQDQMPGGMAQVLNLFSNLIQTQGQAIQTLVSAQAQQAMKAINDTGATSGNLAPGQPATPVTTTP